MFRVCFPVEKWKTMEFPARVYRYIFSFLIKIPVELNRSVGGEMKVRVRCGENQSA